MFPFMRKADTGYKAALGIIIAVVNALPFLLGVLKFFFAHFPMLNLFAIGFCVLGGLFTFKIFSDYIDKFLWIELTAAVSSIVSCVFWGLFRKYSRYVESIKANVKSGAFALAAQNNNAEVSE